MMPNESVKTTVMRGHSTRAVAILSDVLEALENRAKETHNAEALLRGFGAWLGVFDDSPTILAEAALEACSRDGAGRHYRDVAVLGLAGASLPQSSSTERIANRFRDGMRWMRGRKFFIPGQPPSFEADGIALIGVAAGIAALSADDVGNSDCDWLGGILQAGSGRGRADDWSHSLISAASVVLDSACSTTGDSAIAKSLTPDLRAALAAKGFLSLSVDEETEARLTIVSPTFHRLAPDRSAVQVCALRWLMRSAALATPHRMTVVEVGNVLRMVPHTLKRWPWELKPRTKRSAAVAQRWDIQNEYHVQSLLWALLAPLLPDLEDEEYLRSLGHAHPRADLAVPSLQLIIEAKFLRSGVQSELAAVINEVAADVALYLSPQSSFRQIIAFVWDDSRSNNQHHELMAGLRAVGVADAIVVSRPGAWHSHISP